MRHMGVTLEGTGLAQQSGGEGSRIDVALSELAFEALTSGRDDLDASLRMASALRCYLGDRDSGRPAWSYPAFLRGSETRGETQVRLDVPGALWRDFEEEATRQGVTVEQLAEHAAFYFAAEFDAGRVTQRILDDLQSGEDAD
jgi:hypothetical protein